MKAKSWKKILQEKLEDAPAHLPNLDQLESIATDAQAGLSFLKQAVQAGGELAGLLQEREKLEQKMAGLLGQPTPSRETRQFALAEIPNMVERRKSELDWLANKATAVTAAVARQKEAAEWIRKRKEKLPDWSKWRDIQREVQKGKAKAELVTRLKKLVLEPLNIKPKKTPEPKEKIDQAMKATARNSDDLAERQERLREKSLAKRKEEQRVERKQEEKREQRRKSKKDKFD